ncbi:MAG: thioredoxin family protein [Tannerella sp.]|jgi:glutaredoxin|nr:thioredoxin family protein [Tannerella sp.]
MKHIKLFYLRDCPFCKKAFAYIDELKKQEAYKNIEIETIEESEYPEIADAYDYYYVPTFYIDGEKVHEGGIFPNEVEELFKKASLVS